MRGARYTVTFLCCLLMVPTCATLLDGVSADTTEAALIAGALLGFAYLLLRPVLRLLTIPIGCLTLGISNFIIDAVLLYSLPAFVDGFHVDGVLWAALASLTINAVLLIAGGRK